MDFSNFKKKLISNLDECSNILEKVVVGRLATCLFENRELSGYGIKFIPFDSDLVLSNREFYEQLELLDVDLSDMKVLEYLFSKGSVEFKPIIKNQLENVPHLSKPEVCHILSNLPCITWDFADTIEIEEISDTFIDEIFDGESKRDVVGIRFPDNYNWYVFSKYNVVVKIRCNSNDSIRVEQSEPEDILGSFIHRKVDSTKPTKNIFVRFPWIKEKTNVFKMNNVLEILDLFEDFHGIFDGSIMKNSSIFLFNSQTLLDTIGCLITLNNSNQFSIDRVLKIDTDKILVEKDPTSDCHPQKAMIEKSIPFAPIFNKLVEKHYRKINIPDGSDSDRVVNEIIEKAPRTQIGYLLQELQSKSVMGNVLYRQRQNIYVEGFIGGYFDSIELSENVRKVVADELFKKYNLAFFRKYVRALLLQNKNSNDLLVKYILKKYKTLGEDSFKQRFPLTAAAVEFTSKPCSVGTINVIDSSQLSKSIASKLF